MQVAEWLKRAERRLSKASIRTARLDALILLEDLLSRDRSWILANPEFELSASKIKVLNNVLNRRLHHEPLAYIRGKTEFYGREFVITPNVLEPRPESETMIDCLLKLPGLGPKDRIADIGSGSGAIGITAALELQDDNVSLIEVEQKALKVSKMNVDKFTLSLSVISSDLLRGSDEEYDILLCNLPYIPDDFHINLAATHEPKLAIFGGKDGLNVYRKLFKQVKLLKFRPLYILTESLPMQHAALSEIAKQSEYILKKTDDFIQVFSRA